MSTRSKAYVTVFALIVCIGIGLIIASRLLPNNAHTHVLNQAAPHTGPARTVPASSEKPAKIYRVVVLNNEPQLQSVEVKAIPGKSPVESALLQLIREGETKDSANPIPGGTKLLSLKVTGKLAIINFSKEFRDNFNGGSDGESLTVEAILRTIGQFRQIKQVQLLVEGKPLDTLGHLDLSEPLDVSGTVTNSGGEN